VALVSAAMKSIRHALEALYGMWQYREGIFKITSRIDSP